MTDRPFHIVLPSDANKDLFPENRANFFKVKLESPIHLDSRGDWEVALTTLTVPSKLETDHDKTCWFQLINAKGEKGEKYYLGGAERYENEQDFLGQACLFIKNSRGGNMIIHILSEISLIVFHDPNYGSERIPNPA